jgi:serine/threonine protein phosphatase PrpC
MLKLGETLCISNLGDSLAFVVKCDETDVNDSLEIIHQTKTHKPDDPLKRTRVEAAGGIVLDSPFTGASSRLLIPKPNGDEAGLAMSRSLGNAEGDRVGHLAEPTTNVLSPRNLVTANKNTNVKFLCVCASDGLLDEVSPLHVAQHVATSFLPHHPLLPLEAAEQLLLQASKGWSQEVMGGNHRDDITIAAHKL